jgi:hypothetical protein
VKPGFYSEPSNFIYGLQSGENWYYTDYKTKEVQVQIALRGTAIKDARYVLFYENVPLRAEFTRDQKAREKKAL